jgi:glyoxylase-like metal-dependent hydrolase (beta-lactamase superfamily II)
MNLEDHAGDVIRKARLMAKLEPAAAAKAAGLAETDYAALEDSGQSARKPNFAALGELLGLNGRKLEGVFNGWLPAKMDLSRWRHLRWLSTEGNGMIVHSYLIWDETTREAALFDTGWTAEPAFQQIAEQRLQLEHLFITHTHADHIAGLEAVRAKFPSAKVHTDARSAPLQQRNRREDCLQLGRLRISNRDTPGHAEDGVTYVVSAWAEAAPPVAIVGDAIFAGSMGGAPQHGGLARQKVREQILSLPPDTLICPGHGPLTTVGEQKAANPFY